MSTAGVLTVLVCHNGEQWLPDVLEALEAQTVRPQYILAVDTGSVDETAEILTEPLAEHLLDGVITLDADTGFGAAVAVALNTAAQRWEYPGSWVWLLHDDCAPEPDCLATLLAAAEGGRSVGIVGPLALDWSDSRLVVGAGVSTDASGHRQTGLTRDELDWSRFDRQLAGRRVGADTEVLAVGSAGALVRRALWEELGGYDLDLPLFGDDVDFCWRVNHAGRAVLFVPRARVRHVRAASLRLRDTEALGNGDAPAASRSHGLRTYLANCGRGSYLLGLPRLMLLCLLRGIGFTLLRRTEAAGVELRALGYLLRGGDRLRAARRERRATARGGSVSGLFTTRFTRLRNAFRAVASSIERRRVLSDATLGRLPGDGEPRGTRIVPDAELAPVPPAEPPPANSAKHAPVMGLRRPATSVVFALPDQPVVEAPPVPRQTAETPAAKDEAPEDDAAEDDAAEVPEDKAPEDDAAGDAPAGDQADERHADEADAAEDAAMSEDAVSEDAVSADAAGEPGEQSAEPVAETAVATEPATETAVATEPVTRSKHLLRRRLRPYAVRSDDPRSADADLMLVTVSRRRVLADIVLAPPVLLVVALTAVSLVAGAERLGGFLSGGRLLPLQGLAATWSSYLAAWHSVAGGTAAPAPAALAVLGILGAPFAPIGGPAAAVTTLLLADPPLAGLFAYLVTRRMPVSRLVRALAAAGYALLPPAVIAVGQGRLDAVVVHILLPPVLAGIVGVLTQQRRGASGTAWLSYAVVTAIGLAVIGAFSPLVHLLLLLVALVGFVVLPAAGGAGRRRIAALFTVALLPLALLLPWPAVVLGEPSVLLQGVGAHVVGQRPSVLDLVSLTPGSGGMREGPAYGVLPYVGLLLLLATVVAMVLRWRRAVLPGLGLVVLGAAATATVYVVALVPLGATSPEHGWVGTPLVVVGAGLLWTIMGACEWPGSRRGAVGLARIGGFAIAGVGAATVLVLGASAVLSGGAGPLRTGGGLRLAGEQADALARDHSSVLVLADDGQPSRLVAGRTPRFGDDDIPPPPGAEARLAGWDADLRSGDPLRTSAAIAAAVTSGVRFVVLPDAALADRMRGSAGDLASTVAAASDGRPVLRLEPTGGSVTLTAPARSRLAVNGGAPPAEVGAQGVVPVDAAPPNVAVRVSDGPDGRLLVLAANDEASWQAEINGRPAPTTTAWGHLVSVAVPPKTADVAVYSPPLLRDVLLLVQLAAALFALFTAVPSRPRDAVGR